MLNGCRRFLASLVGILSIATIGLLAVGEGTASAEIHGHKIKYVTHRAYEQCTTGMNEKFNTIPPSCQPLKEGENLDKDELLWVGEVKITWYYDKNSTTGEPGSHKDSSCSVSESQLDNYVTCKDPMLE